MANKNYQKGRRKEWAVQKMLENIGYSTARSAGSHGIWDVCATRKGTTRLIQIKLNCSIEPDEKEVFENLGVALGVIKEVWYFKSGQKLPTIEVIKNA